MHAECGVEEMVVMLEEANVGGRPLKRHAAAITRVMRSTKRVGKMHLCNVQYPFDGEDLLNFVRVPMYCEEIDVFLTVTNGVC